MIGAGPRGAKKGVSAQKNGSALLFAVGDDFDLDEADEELPLAPSPHRYGAVRGYGTTS